tara:strand:- start:13 stop:702 length:690 start_codon:yes stop_codon:yes gene_type:complete
MSINTYGQEGSSKSIKLYTNFNFVTGDLILIIPDSIPYNRAYAEAKNHQLGYFSPAFAIELENGNFHEFELSRLLINFNRNESIVIDDSLGRKIVVPGARNTRVLLAVRYEYNIALSNSTEEMKFQPYLGLSINPFFENSIKTPHIISQFATSKNEFGALFAIVPRIKYNLKGNWYLDLNVPINISQASVTINTDEDPILTASQRKSTTFDFEIVPRNIMVRFAIGLRI